MKKSSVIKYESDNLEISFSPESKTFELPKGTLTQGQLEELVKLAVEVLNDANGSDFSALMAGFNPPAEVKPVPPQFAASPPGMDLDPW